MPGGGGEARVEDGRHHGRGPQLPGLRGSRGKGDFDLGELLLLVKQAFFLKPTRNIAELK